MLGLVHMVRCVAAIFKIQKLDCVVDHDTVHMVQFALHVIHTCVWCHTWMGSIPILCDYDVQFQCEYIANRIQTHHTMWKISRKCMYKTAVTHRANRTVWTDIEYSFSYIAIATVIYSSEPMGCMRFNVSVHMVNLQLRQQHRNWHCNEWILHSRIVIVTAMSSPSQSYHLNGILHTVHLHGVKVAEFPKFALIHGILLSLLI